MDKVSIALFGKINKMFAEDQSDIFIAFNSVAVPYEPVTFQRDLHSETNIPLKVATFREPTGRDNYIWTSYKETLDHAEAAGSTWDQSKWEQFEQLTRQLEDMDPLYQKYKKEYEDLIAERKGEQTALLQLSDGPEKEEKKERIKDLNQLVDQKMAEWKTRGKKMQYEAIQNQILGSEPEYPVQVIQKYKEELEAAEVGGDAASGQIVYSTSFAPSDFFEENGSGWITFTLDKEEVNNMAQYALDTVFAGQKTSILPSAGDDQLEIERISAEIGALHINRNWLNPNFFHAGYWRLANGFESEILSDGDAANPSGRLPALVEKVLFIKKLDIELKPNSKINQETIEKNQREGTPLLFGNMILKMPVDQKAGQIRNISKPTRINSLIAAKYRAAAITNRELGIQKLYAPAYHSNFKNSLNFYYKFNYNVLKDAATFSQTATSASVLNTTPTATAILNNANNFGSSAIPGVSVLGRSAAGTTAPRHLPPGATYFQGSQKYQIDLSQLTAIQVHAVNITFGFEGTLRSDDGKPLAGVKLSFIDTINTKKEYLITTNSSGQYKAILPAGPYQLEIDHVGFFRFASKLTYERGQKLAVTRFDIVLHKDPESEIEDQFSFVCLGMLCRRLPKSPNPDLSLQWD